jgi:hypothetical protein
MKDYDCETSSQRSPGDLFKEFVQAGAATPSNQLRSQDVTKTGAVGLVERAQREQATKLIASKQGEMSGGKQGNKSRSRQIDNATSKGEKMAEEMVNGVVELDGNREGEDRNRNRLEKAVGSRERKIADILSFLDEDSSATIVRNTTTRVVPTQSSSTSWADRDPSAASNPPTTPMDHNISPEGRKGVAAMIAEQSTTPKRPLAMPGNHTPKRMRADPVDDIVSPVRRSLSIDDR